VLKKEITEGLRTGAGYGLVTAAVLHFVPTLPLVGALLAPVAAPLIVATVAIAAFLKGLHKWNESQLLVAQAKLRQHLNASLLQVRNQYVEVNIESGRLCVVDEYFEKLERSMLGQVQALAKQKSQEALAEIARLEEIAKADNVQRKQQLEKVDSQIKTWTELNRKLVEVASQLERMAPGSRIVSAASTGGA
jgi:predicted house-cleaning noncanonical NTP pyrophosphatase (MazG superfamily)